MRSRIIVLLAVCSNLAAAGILRHKGARAQHQNVARFLNHTGIPSIPADIQTSTPVLVPISSSSIKPLIAASQESSLFAVAFSTIPTATPLLPDAASSSSSTAHVLTPSALNRPSSISVTLPTTLSTTAGSEHSQAGSEADPTSTEAATMQPAETLSRLFNIAGDSANNLQSSIISQSLSSTSSPNLGASLSIISEIPSTASNRIMGATSSSSFVENQATSTLEAPLRNSSPADASQPTSYSTKFIPTSSHAASQTPSPVVVPVPANSGLVQVLGADGDTTDEFAPVTLVPSSPAPTGTAKYPTAGAGNTAMAAGYNSVYKTLNEDSPCNPADPSQAYACVEGEIAECQSDETYVLKSCPQGQSCYALPKPSGSTGVVVQCAVPSDAYSILAGLSSSTAVPVAFTSQPAQFLQAEGGLSQATQSVSAQNPVPSSPSAQASAQSQTTAPAPTVLAVIAATSQDQDHVSTDTSPTSAQSAFQSQSQAFQSPEFVVTATAPQVHDSNALNSSPKSDTPDTSPPAPSTTAAVVSSLTPLFAVVTAPENSGASSASNPTPQASQTPTTIATSVAQSSATPPQASPDNFQSTEASVTSADGVGTTFSPTGVPVNEKVAVGNGQATVTVTVTVTTTERPAPVTIFAS